MSGQISDITFTFGKYRGERVVDIIEKDINYCIWLISNDDFKAQHLVLYNFFLKSGVDATKYNQLKQEKSDYKREHFTFGKYKGQKISEIFIKDRQYCEYISKLDNVQKYHSETVETINDFLHSYST